MENLIKNPPVHTKDSLMLMSNIDVMRICQRRFIPGRGSQHVLSMSKEEKIDLILDVQEALTLSGQEILEWSYLKSSTSSKQIQEEIKYLQGISDNKILRAYLEGDYPTFYALGFLETDLSDVVYRAVIIDIIRLRQLDMLRLLLSRNQKPDCMWMSLDRKIPVDNAIIVEFKKFGARVFVKKNTNEYQVRYL